MKWDKAYADWVARDPDSNTREQLRAMYKRQDNAALAACLGARLTFGTAGLRGVVGPGPGRMNRLVVRETTAGLGAYLKAVVADAKSRGVVVGFDGRIDSQDFATDAVRVLHAMGFRVLLLEQCAPTPVCAFAVRLYQAAAGVVVTASHNPPEYNGYKVYWEHGAQILAPHDKGIMGRIEQAAREDLPWEGDAAPLPRCKSVYQAAVDAYATALRARADQLREPGGANQPGGSMQLAYTPLHGVGVAVAEAILEKEGFGVHTVAAQREPDGHFPTLTAPNPEHPGTMQAVCELADAKGLAFACANDPDADRLAVAVRNRDGQLVQLTGDQLGTLLAAYLLERYEGPTPAAVGNTVVSSRMLQRLAQAGGAYYFETLTGFKWLQHGTRQQTAQGRHTLLTYEEALGYCVGDAVADKDGISALLCFCQLAQACAAQQGSPWRMLEALYRQHGLFVTLQRTIPLPAADTRADANAQTNASGPPSRPPSLTDTLRASPQTNCAGRKIISTVDYAAKDQSTATDLPPSDMIAWQLEDGIRVVVRPSGTEPKVKCYYEWESTLGSDATLDDAWPKGQQYLNQFADAHQQLLHTLTNERA